VYCVGRLVVSRCLKVDIYSTKDDLFPSEHCCNGLATQPVSATTGYICEYYIINWIYRFIILYTRLKWLRPALYEYYILWYILCINFVYSIDNIPLCEWFFSITLYSGESRCIIITHAHCSYILLYYCVRTYLKKCVIIYYTRCMYRYVLCLYHGYWVGI